jgi:hypothetical protein
VFEPLTLPHDCAMEHAHGISIDESDDSIIVTYKDANDPSKCLLKWSIGEYNTQPAEYLGPGEALCRGVPHGLATIREEKTIRPSSRDDDDVEEFVLYHANNEQALHKTTMDGRIIWSALGPPPPLQTQTTSPFRNKTTIRSDDTPYSPTWTAAAPDSPYLYVADGYGSNHVYVYHKSNGTYTGHVFGGTGSEHGKFQTCHSIYWDARNGKMAVCDRENQRLEYFDISDSSASTAADPRRRPMFTYSHSHTFEPFLQRLCNLRVQQRDGDGSEGRMGILASLEGMVGIVNAQNELVSVLNISDTLGHIGYLHPHDAHFLPGADGSFVLVTWNPGRVGYFRRVRRVVTDDQTIATTTR